jgi:hypothetical protein
MPLLAPVTVLALYVLPAQLALASFNSSNSSARDTNSVAGPQ